MAQAQATAQAQAPKALSLFSGCGGDTVGMTSAGFNVVAYNEFNKAAIQSHTLNFPDATLLQGTSPDITKVPDAVFATYKGGVDLVFAGFPCQGFSRGGKRKVDDPRNQMYLQFVRVVKLTKPTFFIGENVTGLTSMRSGPADTDPLVLDKIKKAFQDIGYELTHQVVEATEFGVPQKRKRILLVGWQPEHTDFDTASFWADVNAAAAAATTMRTFVTPCMDGAFEIPSANVPDDFADYALPIPQSAVPTGTPHPYVVLKASATNEEYGGVTYKSLLTCSKRGSPIHSEIIDVDKPCKTIICTYDHQPRLLVGLRKPDGTAYCRALLPDELKQIQGFPATYKIHGTTKEQVTQIGNAVPPPIIEAVAAALKLRLI